MAELSQNKYLTFIVGPTASGKTDLSIYLANELNCPILSTDSRQLYREMTIGTAKPSAEDLAKAEHHLIDNRSIHDHYTAGMYEIDAIFELEQIFKKHSDCLAVGGSGLYINALAYGIDDIPSNDEVRELLENRWKTEGLEALQEEVQRVDPEYFNQADMQNPRRVMRALEVYIITGNKYSSYRKNASKSRPFHMIWVGLEVDMDLLYDRINKRVDEMIEKGLFEEVEKLHPHKSLKAMKTVGYQEIVQFLDGEITKDKAIELVKRNTRRFARKQYSWFRRNDQIKWFDPNDRTEILDFIKASKAK